MLESPLVWCTWELGDPGGYWYGQRIKGEWLAWLWLCYLNINTRFLFLTSPEVKGTISEGKVLVVTLPGPEQPSFLPTSTQNLSIIQTDWLARCEVLSPQNPSHLSDSSSARAPITQNNYFLLVPGTGPVNRAGFISSTPTDTVKESLPTPANSPWMVESLPWWREHKNNTSVIM